MNKLKSDMLLMLSGNLVLAFSQWLLIAGLNYSGDIESVGRYSYALALAGLFLTIGQAGVRQYLMSSNIPSAHINQLFITRLITSLCTFLLLTAYANWLVEPVYFWIILALGIAKLIENMSDLAHGFYLRKFDIFGITRSRIFRSVTTPCTFLGAYYLLDSLLLACLALCLAWLVTYIVCDKSGIDAESKQIRKTDQVPSVIVTAYPMGVTAVLVLLSVNIPLFVLAEMRSDLDVGHYASVFYFVTAGSLVIQSALQVLSPTLISLIKDSLFSHIVRLSLKSYGLSALYGLVILAGAWLLGEWLVVFLYGDSYKGLGGLVTLAAYVNLMLAIQAVGGIILTAFGVFKYQMQVMVGSVIFGVATSVWLVPLYGVSGAFIAGAMTAAFNAVFFGIRVFHELHKK